MIRYTRRMLIVAGAAAGADPGLLSRVERKAIWRGRETGQPTWFHPRACRLPGGRLLMAVQTISGSDVYGPVHWSESTDSGDTWSDPAPIPGLGRRKHPDGVEEGVCDTVPEYHPASGSTLFVGINVYYRDEKLTRPSEQRWPVYVSRRADGTWTAARKFEWRHPEATALYSSNCSQRWTLPNGEILMPLTYGPLGRDDRGVGTVLCAYDGNVLRPLRHGNTLRLPVKRGLLEPSICRFQTRFYLTIRAEDGHGYLSESRDGLDWGPIEKWRWEDGEPLAMSTTQQHWMVHSSALYLVYTRRTGKNANVMRWRAPLYAARFDARRRALVRSSEVELIPMSGDGIAEPDKVSRLGNFHVTNADEGRTLVTVGETMPARGWSGNTIQATVHWGRPNRAE